MITATFPDNADQTKPFPKIMRSTKTGMIVLFKEEGRGAVLHQARSISPAGTTSENWTMGFFEDYNGPVTLQNK